MLKNKRYFQIIILLLGIYICILYILSHIYVNLISETKEFFKINKKLEIINLGSSHSYYGIKYPQNVKARNLALSSQNLYYDSKILKKYESQLQSKGKVVIPISIFSFYDKDNLDNNEWLNDRYHAILEYKDIYGGTRKKEFLIKNMYLFYDGKAIISLIKFLKNSRVNKWPKEKLTLSEKIDEANITTERHLKNKKFDLKNIKNILEICQNNDLIPILITTPQTYLYNERIGNKNYRERIYNNIKELEKNYKFIYFDYSHDDRFENNLELFYDDDHLNEEGAEYFTKILLEDIERKVKK